MKFTAEQIAEILQGKIDGNKKVSVSSISEIDKSCEDSLCFLSNEKYEEYIYSTKANIVIVNKNFSPKKKISATLIRVDNSYSAFAKIMLMLASEISNKKGISSKASISSKAKIGKDVYIGDFVVIEDGVFIDDAVSIFPNTYIGLNVRIGKKTNIFQNVSIYNNCVIGVQCTFHSGVIIGSDGFGFAPQNTGDYFKVPQLGNVIIEDFVEIGSNSTIDRATIGSTIIRKGVKLDNLIQVAHNVEIGENTVIAAQVGISGSTKIGKNCMIGGQVGIAGHLTIADNVKIGAKAGVMNSILQNGVTYIGAPAVESKEFWRTQVYIKNLPKTNKELRDLKKEIRK